MINFGQFESRGREKIRKSRLLTRLDVKKTQVEGRGAMILVPFHHPGGSFGVVPFRQRAGNFSLLLATSRYVRYYVLLRSLPWDREDRQKGVRIVAADIKDIPPPPPLLLTNERDRSLLQLRQSHLLISAALIIHYPRPPTLRTNLDPTFANPCYKSFHSPPRFRFRCYVVTDYMREGINSEIDSSFSVVFYSFKKKNLLG